MSSTLSNVPETRPALMSASPSAIARSTTDFGAKVILPFSNLASRRSPTLTSICSRTLCGMSAWYLFLTVTIAILLELNG